MSDISVARNIRGAFDYLPEKQRVRRDIIKILTECFEKYGFSPVETPILNYLDLMAFKYAGGNEILKEVYSLKDQGERDLALRYDLTVPMCKLVAMHPQLPMPFKRYEIGKVFRNGPVKSGRNREFTQCDVDMAGAASLMAEVEFLTMTAEVFEKLGLPIRVELSSRRLLSGLIIASGISPDKTADAITAVDKLAKVGKTAVRAELEQAGIPGECADKLFSYFDMSFDDLKCAEIPENDALAAGKDELSRLWAMLDAAGVSSILRYAPWLARGLDIYTGCVWEVFMTEGGVTSSIGAGGRYDNIIGKLAGTREITGVGMTFGLDVIYAVLCERGDADKGNEIQVFIISMNEDVAAVRLAAGLRRAGVRVGLETAERKLKKSLDYANKEAIPFVFIIGENEVLENKAQLKDMLNGGGNSFALDNYTAISQSLR